jgi:5-epi-alpha-selinene synthase
VNNSQLPVLYCPFHSAINQHCELAYQHTFEWVRSFNLLEELACQRLFATKLHVLVARVYPNTSLKTLELLTDFMYWGSILDDGFEKVGTSRPEDILEPDQARLLDILKGAKITKVDTLLAFAWGDIVQRLHQLPYVTSEWMLYFTKHMEDYFQAVRWEAINYSQGIMLDIATYIKMRHIVSGIYPFLDMILIAEGIVLPPEVIECLTLKRMGLTANNAISWANDIFSFKRDLKEGMVNNLVLILQHEYQIPLEEAFKRAVELHDAQVQNFIELSMQLPSFGDEIDVNLQCYVLGLRFWMSGHLNLIMESRRYGKFSEDQPL